MDLRLVSEQQFDERAIATLGCRMQRGPAAALRGIHVGAILEQQLRQWESPAGSSRMKRSVAHMVCGASIDLRAARQQCRSCLLAAEERGQMERRPAIGAMGLEERGVL